MLKTKNPKGYITIENIDTYDNGEKERLITIRLDRTNFKAIPCKRLRCRSIIGFSDGVTLLVTEYNRGSAGIPKGSPHRWKDEQILIEGLEKSDLNKLSELRKFVGALGGQYPVSGWVLNGRGVNITCHVCTNLRKFAGTQILIDDGALFDIMLP